MNFVYVVGYSLEKVHSGVLARLVDGPHGSAVVAAFWNALCPQPIAPEDVKQPKAVREHKIGPRAVVDLLISFRNNQTGEKHHLVCEYKVEGTGNHDGQCQRFRDHWESKHPDEPTCFAFITTGGARFWTPPPPSCFQHVDLPALLKLLSPYREHRLVHDYTEALEDEQLRGALAPAVAGLSPAEKRELGYRSYSWWYAYYHALRTKFAAPQEWDIYSGTRNPVMRWRPSWAWKDEESRNKCPFGMFYCEFNRSSLMLKFGWYDRAGTPANVQRLRQALIAGSSDLGRYGFETCLRRKKANKYTSAAKVPLDFTQPLDALAQQVQKFVPSGFWTTASKLVARID